MDWIHCNNCFSQLDPGITLHLTSCGHMFCNNCLENGEFTNSQRVKAFNFFSVYINIYYFRCKAKYVSSMSHAMLHYETRS